MPDICYRASWRAGIGGLRARLGVFAQCRTAPDQSEHRAGGLPGGMVDGARIGRSRLVGQQRRVSVSDGLDRVLELAGGSGIPRAQLGDTGAEQALYILV